MLTTWITAPGNQTAECTGPNGASASFSATATDNCGGAITTGCSPASGSTFPLGTTTDTCTATDNAGNKSDCSFTVTVVDTVKPEIQCNSPTTITPPNAPISFTATATDLCRAVSPRVTGYDCWMINGDGKEVDKKGSCVVNVNGDSITIVDSGGVDDHITWTVTATDVGGNTITNTCEVVVVNPGKGGGKGKK